MNKISVVVPVYNVKAFLPGCIESLLAQTYPNMEIILVDDGSVDGSGEICDSYADQYTNVKVVHQPNAGVSAARNHGIRISTGEFIGFVDADDHVTPDMYAHLSSLCLRWGVEIAQCAYARTEALYEEQAPIDEMNTHVKILRRDDALHQLLCSQSVRSRVCNKLYSRRLMEDFNFNAELVAGEDGVANYQLISKVEQVAVSDKVCYLYYQRENSCTNGALNDKVYQSIGIIDEYGKTQQNEDLKQSWRFNSAVKAINYLRRAAKEGCWEHFDEMRSYALASMGVLLHPRKFAVTGDPAILLHIFLLCVFPRVYRKLLSRKSIET